jgi:membrane protein YdbS with pleckstrin-like domain
MFRNRPIAFIVGWLFLLIGTFSLANGQREVLWPVVLVAALFLLWWLRCRTTTLTITPRVIELRRGLLARSTNEVRHQDVRNIRVTQTLGQRVFGVGSVAVSTAGQADIEIEVSGIPHPVRVRQIINDCRDGRLPAAIPAAAAARPEGKEHTPPVRGPIPLIKGSGTFDLDVVGESRYRDSFEAICGPRCEDGYTVQVKAEIEPEPDNPYDRNAVRVTVGGRTVGYLARPDAQTWRSAQALGLLPNGPVRAMAQIRGGWDRGDGDAGDFGLRLDLPWPAIVRRVSERTQAKR